METYRINSLTKRFIAILSILMIAITTCAAFTFTADAASKKPSKYTWKEKAAPNYVVKVGKARVSGKPKKGTIKYSKLDKYGRTRRAVGNITYKMVRASAGWRQEFEEGSDPSGWGENRIVKIKLYNGKYYKGFLWNRSHLIADSLGGRAFRRNLITGTRMQNVGANNGSGGMAYTERKVVNYLYRHHNASVFYSANPVYKGKELVPRSVIVDIKSSDGKLNERVIVYNAAKGFKINYRKGMAKRTSVDESVPAVTPPSGAQLYVLNTNTMKFHYPSCKSVGEMAQHNKQEEVTTRDILISKGYSPCGNCRP